MPPVPVPGGRRASAEQQWLDAIADIERHLDRIEEEIKKIVAQREELRRERDEARAEAKRLANELTKVLKGRKRTDQTDK